MRKGKTLIGKDVLSLADGQKLHSVKDVLIGSDNAEIVALLVDEGGLLSSSRVVPIESIESFGKDAVVVSDSASIVSASRYPRVNAILNNKEKLVGKKVFTEAGEEQGSVSDMYFDETTGRIEGFEVSGGVLSNVSSGASYLPVEDIVRAGPDVLYIRAEAVEALDSQTGGLKGALQSAQGKLGEASDQAKSNVQSSNPEESLIGRRSGADVQDENGNIVVAAGQRIRAEHVERARQSGNLDVLMKSGGAGQAQEVGDQTAAALGQVGDAAGSMWDQLTRKIGEMTDASGKRTDEQTTRKRLADIEDAVGRPVTKVILDRQDNVVLNLGDIITHEAVQRAYDAGALDSLLGSVYRGDIAFSKEEMMARQEGTATVEKATGAAPLVDELQGKVDQAEHERQQQKEQQRAQAEEDRQRREQERQQRAEERDQQAQQRQQEITDAQQSTPSEPSDYAEQQPEQQPEQHYAPPLSSGPEIWAEPATKDRDRAIVQTTSTVERTPDF